MKCWCLKMSKQWSGSFAKNIFGPCFRITHCTSGRLGIEVTVAAWVCYPLLPAVGPAAVAGVAP